MVFTRRSPALQRNANVQPLDSIPGSNRAFVTQVAARGLDLRGALLLLGGTTLCDFRVRVAQSDARDDLLPSFWSLAGLLTGPSTFLSVPLDVAGDPSRVPATNGIRSCRLADYDGVDQYPNIAVLRFTEGGSRVVESARRLVGHRAAVDLPSLIVPWLGFVVGATHQRNNPLFEQIGVPSAVFIESAFSMAGVELTPGIVSSSTSPEAIWQSAVWWHPYYEKAVGANPSRSDHESKRVVPYGYFVTRQRAAAALG